SITTSDSHTSLQYRVLYHAAARVEQSYQPAIRSLSVLSLRTLIVWAWNNTRPLCPAAVLSWRRTHPMRHRLLCAALLCATLLFALLAPSPRSSAQPGDDVIRPDQVVLQPDPAAKSSARDYLWPPTEAAHPFSHMLLRREAHVPDGASLTLYVRASIDGAKWGEWTEVLENDDLWAESDGPDVEWSQTIDAGALARFWQVGGGPAPTPNGARPDLRQIQVNAVDALGSPPPRPVVEPQSATPAALPKPPVVSRVGWGSPDGEGSRAAPNYYPVNHM